MKLKIFQSSSGGVSIENEINGWLEALPVIQIHNISVVNLVREDIVYERVFIFYSLQLKVETSYDTKVSTPEIPDSSQPITEKGKPMYRVIKELGDGIGLIPIGAIFEEVPSDDFCLHYFPNASDRNEYVSVSKLFAADHPEIYEKIEESKTDEIPS